MIIFYLQNCQCFLAGSENVTDEGLSRACYTARFMMSSRYDIRNALYKFYMRVSLIGDKEQTTSLWEYRTWDSEYWDKRTRGLGPSLAIPMSSVGDDNQRCKPGERWLSVTYIILISSELSKILLPHSFNKIL